MRLAFFQPDIAQNLGASLRLAACMAVPIDIIEPCGFPLTDKSLRRTAMDYGERASWIRHDGWASFLASPARNEGRLVLFTTRAAVPLTRFVFEAGDTLLFGRESVGVPDFVHEAAQASVVIPLAPGLRSMNVAMTAAMGLWEGLRQTGTTPSETQT